MAIVREILDHRGHTASVIQTDTNDPTVMHHILREDVDPIIKECAALAENLTPNSDFKPLATIPNVVWQKMLQEGSVHDDNYLKKWLNDSANKCFRIWPGRV